MAMWRRQRRALVTLTVFVGLVATLVANRTLLLRSAGWILASDDPLRPSDAVVIAIDAGDAGVLEAADLVHDGIAARVAVFADPPNAVDLEFIRRGIAHEGRAERVTRLLRALNVESVEQIPRKVVGTEDEGLALPDWCDRGHLRSVVVVTNPDHSRRLRRVLRRAMKDRLIDVMVRKARYSEFDPDRWWQSRAGIRIEIVEFEKLLADVVRHPIS